VPLNDEFDAPARWHTEPFDPDVDEAPSGTDDDCTGEDGDHDGA